MQSSSHLTLDVLPSFLLNLPQVGGRIAGGFGEFDGLGTCGGLFPGGY